MRKQKLQKQQKKAEKRESEIKGEQEWDRQKKKTVVNKALILLHRNASLDKLFA